MVDETFSRLELNRYDYLRDVLTDFETQDYKNFEYIVIDGGSTDNSVELIKKYDSQIDYWVSEPDNGQSNASNKGFEKATGTIKY